MHCLLCKAIKQNKRHAIGHAKLQEMPTRKKVRTGQASIHVTYHSCEDCGTMWRHEDNRNDDNAGWTSE